MRIATIFKSINGEVNALHQGSVCGFIRLAGCNCQCSYCDTKRWQKKDSGTNMTAKEIIQKVNDLKCQTVTITGGEPLLQKRALINLILDLGQTHHTSIETNGSIEIPKNIPYIDSWVIDYKCSSSGMKHKMKLSNFITARNSDFIKFVIADRKDFDDAIALIGKVRQQRVDYHLLKWCFSPMFIKNNFSSTAKELYSWISQEPVLKPCIPIINVQIHKILSLE